MKKLTLIIAVVIMGVLAFLGLAATKVDNQTGKNAYDFSFEKIAGGELPLSAYKGKVLLIVNTASLCGFTPQYEGLEKLYENYKDKGLVVIAVPSNDFGGQEPETNANIKTFCEVKFAITFPLAAKVDVVGENAHPFYKWAAEILGFGSKPKWNFHKYLVGRDGNLIDFYNSTTTPQSANLIQAIEKALEVSDKNP
jgi:glutathione peroxidase